jgi:hypothetical protein
LNPSFIYIMSIFKYKVFLECGESLETYGYYQFRLSDEAKRIRNEAFALDMDKLEVNVKTHHKTAIRMKTDDFIDDNDPKLHELCQLYSRAFREILALTIFQNAENQPFIDGRQRYAMVDLVRYNNDDVGGVYIDNSLNVVEHYDTGLMTLTLGATGAGLEIKGKDGWFTPDPDCGIIWIGKDGAKLNLPPCLHRVKWIPGKVRQTTFGLIGHDVPMIGMTNSMTIHERYAGSYCAAPLIRTLESDGSTVHVGADYIDEPYVHFNSESSKNVMNALNLSSA